MIIVPVATVLHGEGLNAPQLNVLDSDANNYSVLLFQPQGQIDATQARIQNRKREMARAQFGGFLEEAVVSQPDLAVTPEYSLPWEVLHKAINGPDKGPAQGKLWALGCESIKYSELLQLKIELANIATVIFEPMQPDDTRFVDPLAYVFRTTEEGGDGQSKLVVLVQFKTHAMAHKQEFEKTHLQLGTTIFQFGVYGAGISLVTLICSDVFDFNDPIAEKVRDRALILHIQLNPEPRHQRFLETRARLLGFGAEPEIITLNWASDTEIWLDNTKVSWRFVACSAWYMKAPEFDSIDGTLATNHRHGFYYTWLDPHRTHTLFLNFKPAMFFLNASKVARPNIPAAVAQRRGPQLMSAKTWDAAQSIWTDNPRLDDGFAAIHIECGNAAAQVMDVFNHCPLACERLLALCAGNADESKEWYYPHKLDSFKLKQTEQIFRITFCQDNDNEVYEFRVRRLRRCAALWTILQTPDNLPSAIKDVSHGYILEWKPESQHQNLRSHSGERATVIYLGEDTNKSTVERTYKTARERVRSSLDEEQGDRAKQRVVVWYRDNGARLLCQCDLPKIDRRRGESEYDIGRQS